MTGKHGHQEAGLTGVHPECSDEVIPLKSLPTGKEGNNIGTEGGSKRSRRERKKTRRRRRGRGRRGGGGGEGRRKGWRCGDRKSVV